MGTSRAEIIIIIILANTEIPNYIEIRILRDLAPPKGSEWNPTDVNTNPRSVIIFVSWKLVNWSKHVWNSVILPSHWSYIVQKQVMGDGVAESTFTLLQDSVPSHWCQSCYFKVRKLHNAALSQFLIDLENITHVVNFKKKPVF